MMILSENSVIIGGHWNRMIFTPEWVGEKLFGRVEQVNVEVPLFPVDPIVFKHEAFNLKVSSSRLIFRGSTHSLIDFQKASDAAKTVLTELNDTPLFGVSIGMAFIEDRPSKELRSCFQFPDEAAAKSMKLLPDPRKITRTYKHLRFGTRFRLNVTENESVYRIETMHFTERTDGSRTPLQVLENGVASYFEHSTDFLKRVFKLKLQEGNP